MPRDLIDVNVRIDYSKLRHLLTVNRGATPNGNFDLLRHVIGEGGMAANVSRSFPLKRLERRDNFLSLLYYFGLLAIRGTRGSRARLAIPNETVRQLMYGYLRDGLSDAEAFEVGHERFPNLVAGMAYRGDWQPVVKYLQEAIRTQTGVRDYLEGEQVVQAFLAAHFGMIAEYLIRSEYELNKGYADLYLEPFAALYPEIGYGYVIELKYLKRGDDADEAAVAERLAEATGQLRRYLADDNLRRRLPDVRHVGLALVFHGWDLVACESVGD